MFLNIILNRIEEFILLYAILIVYLVTGFKILEI